MPISTQTPPPFPPRVTLATADLRKICHGSFPVSVQMATNADFVAYFRTHNFDSAQAHDVADKLVLSGLYSASDFLGFYSTKGTDLHRWWNDQPG